MAAHHVPEHLADGPPRQAARSTCPVAGTLDIVGDRWSLLIVRDLFAGKHRFGELLGSAERIPTSILAERLKRLEREGLIERAAYTNRPPRFEYDLTESGRELGSALVELAKWGLRQGPEPGLRSGSGDGRATNLSSRNTVGTAPDASSRLAARKVFWSAPALAGLEDGPSPAASTAPIQPRPTPARLCGAQKGMRKSAPESAQLPCRRSTSA